jgi:hypothetical protein
MFDHAVIYFNDNVSISGSGTTNISSISGDIYFMGTVQAADPNSKGNEQSLIVRANNGDVTFNDRVGYAFNGVQYSELNGINLWSLDVIADRIIIKADIMTHEEQTYTGSVFIGDNGANGLVRTLLSVDPKVEINGTVDDLDPNTVHTLITKAIALNDDIPLVNITGEVGSINPLVQWIAETGRQNINSVWADVISNTKGQLSYLGQLISGGSQILNTINMSGYVAPVSNSLTSLNSLNSFMAAGELIKLYQSFFRDFVRNYIQNFKSANAKPTISIGAKIVDDLTSSSTSNEDNNSSDNACDINIEEDCKI